MPDRGDRSRVFSHIIAVVEDAQAPVVLDALGPASVALTEDVMTGAEILRLEGERRLLLRLLRSKFGPLPAEVERRLAAADEPTLDAWADAVLTAERLDDVWRPA